VSTRRSQRKAWQRKNDLTQAIFLHCNFQQFAKELKSPNKISLEDVDNNKNFNFATFVFLLRERGKFL
jgi:hypothetical protein